MWTIASASASLHSWCVFLAHAACAGRPASVSPRKQMVTGPLNSAETIAGPAAIPTISAQISRDEDESDRLHPLGQRRRRVEGREPEAPPVQLRRALAQRIIRPRVTILAEKLYFYWTRSPVRENYRRITRIPTILRAGQAS